MFKSIAPAYIENIAYNDYYKFKKDTHNENKIIYHLIDGYTWFINL